MAVKALASVTVSSVADGADGRMLYATCPTAAATAAKVATVSSGTVTLYAGLTVAVQFANANTAASPTLNVDGTGAKAIYVNGAAITPSDYWCAGATRTFVYDGARWVMSDVQSVDVGGTNLVPFAWVIKSAGTPVSGTSTKEMAVSWFAHDLMTHDQLVAQFEPGGTYTVHYDAEFVAPVADVSRLFDGKVGVYFYSASTAGARLPLWTTLVTTSDWSSGLTASYTTTFTLPDEFPSDYSLLGYTPYFRNTADNGYVRSTAIIRNLKIERGTVATDWAPSPQDTESQISNLQTQIDQTASDITLRATKTEVNAIKNTADTALSRTTLRDTRNDNQNPDWYISNYPRQIVNEFKSCSTLGLTGGTFCSLETTVPWVNSSGGYPKQVAKVDNQKTWYRNGTGDTTWSAWINELDAAKTYSDAQLRVQADRITGTVTDVDGLKARTSTLEQTASGLTVSVSKAQGDATQALADAADANANADGVAERANAALRDAQSGINDSIDALSSALTFGLDGLTSSINTVGEDLKNVTTMVRVTQRDQKPLLTLGASNSDAGVDLTNESLEFRVGAQVLASASGSAFSMPVAAVGQSISLGGYMLVAKQGGGFSVKWTGV